MDHLKRKGNSTKRIALAALMLAVLPATASAQAVTGDRLLVSCREFEKTVQLEGDMYRVQLGRATECNNYIKDKISLLKTCQPPGQRVGIPQVVGIFIAFAEANPNALHMNAALLATSALRKAFPCAQETAA